MSAGWRHIDITTAAAMLAEHTAALVDIRDPQAFAAGHIPGAQHLTNQNVAAFLAQGDRQRPLIVCCYHGHSSRDAAEFLAEQGFAEVYSLDGGFEAWRLQQPVE